MLVNQGVIGIKYWTGIDADVQVMRKALESALSLWFLFEAGRHSLIPTVAIQY